MEIRVKIKIKGIKPILINTFPIDGLTGPKSKSGTTGKNPSEWERNVLMSPDRELYVHNTYLIGAIKEGGKQIKVGRGTLSKKVGSCLQTEEDKLFLHGLFVPKPEDMTTNVTDPVYLDVRSVVNPMTKGRNLRYRVAAKPGWELEATLIWDDRAVSKDDMKTCIESAGLFEGIGDGRRIGFGRFEVLSFKSA